MKTMMGNLVSLVHETAAAAGGPGFVWPLLFVLAFACTVVIRTYAADPFGIVPFIAFAALFFSGAAGFVWFFQPLVMTLHAPFMAAVAAIQALMIPAGAVILFVDRKIG